MPPRNRKWRFHGLKNPKIRPDWNKYNFYNLSRLGNQSTASRTYFQQKWTAKAATRAYHGEHINEKKWKRMFSKVTPAVVPMNPVQLAQNDGSYYSAGRGSGKDPKPDEKRESPELTPYMQMLYHPIERRLDTAIFRSLFASSARQARQLVVHGHVKVNGKKMIYPGYLLNPGDMFQVVPERVLRLTGHIRNRAPKDSSRPAASTTSEDFQEEDEEFEESAEEELTEEELSIAETDSSAVSTKKSLLNLRERASQILESPPNGRKLSGRQKQDLRAFRKTLKSSLSRAASITPSALDDLETEFQTISSRIQTAGSDEKPTASEAAVKTDEPHPGPSSPPPPGSRAMKGSVDKSSAPEPEDSPLVEKEEEAEEEDFSERWRPKDFMAAFAFIPRYLEVNQRICSTVYLRNPVCKPGFSEVPTPFPQETSQLAFHWYLKQRG